MGTTQYTADQLVERFVRQAMAEELPVDHHLRTCPEVEFDYEKNTSQCDSGCEHTKLIAWASCPHGFEENVEYGEFGDMDSIIDTLAEWADEGEI